MNCPTAASLPSGHTPETGENIVSKFDVHIIDYTAVIKGTARIAIPDGKRAEDYAHLLANHEVTWNLHTIYDREVTNVTHDTTLELPGGPFVMPTTVSLLSVEEEP